MRRRGWSIPVGLGATLGVVGLLVWAGGAGRQRQSCLLRGDRDRESPHGVDGRALPSVSPGRGGQVRVARLADRLDHVLYEGPDPGRAYYAVRNHWLKMVDPYGGLSADRAFLRLKVAFLVPDVAHYLDPRFPKARAFLGGKRRTWSYARGVYESRLAIFAPVEQRQDTTLSFPVRAREGSVLWFGVGGLPKGRRSGHLEFWIDLLSEGTTRRLWSRSLGPSDMLIWHEDRVDLGPGIDKGGQLVLGCRGDGADGLWLDPVIWAPGRLIHDNILFVVVDTMRPDAVHALGGEEARTPNMDRLVREGTALTRFFTNGAWTRASMVSFFSANYASSVGLTPDKFIFPPKVRQKFYRRRLPQFPAHMERLGYSVAAVVNNFFGLPYQSVGVDHGFSRFTDVRHPVLDSRAITRTAVQFLQRNRNRPFFLYVHYEALHDYDRRPDFWASKIAAPARMDKYRRAYLALANRVDVEVGKLLAALDRLGLWRHTLVILTADHGEVFDKRHNFFIPFFHTKTLHQHARSLWDEVLHIPMVWTMPGRIFAGRRVTTQLRAIDLFPSVLDFLKLPGMGPVAGRSFADLLGRKGRSSVPGTDRALYSEGFHIRSLRQDGFKYIFRDSVAKRFRIGHRLVVRPETLFDLAQDPDEVTDLSHVRPDMVSRMRAAMLRIQEQSRPHRISKGMRRRDSILHFRLCGPRSRRMKLVVWSIRGTDLAGAHGHVVVRPLSEGDVRRLLGPRGAGRLPAGANTSLFCSDAWQGKVRGLDVTMSGSNGCSGVDLVLSGPVRFLAEEDGRVLKSGQVRAGPFGLALLTSPCIDPSNPALVSASMPPALSREADGLFVWTNRRGNFYEDPLSGRRARRSEGLVRMNLLRGGYVKPSSKGR